MMPRQRLAALALAALATLLTLANAGPAASADDFEQGVALAREGLKAQDSAKALRGLRDATAAAWARLPFTVQEVHLLAAPPTGYGQYLERVDNVYRPSEPLILYLEPVGFKVRFDQRTGVYSHNLSADFNLVDAWGRVVAGRRDFGRFAEEAKHFPDRYNLVFTYSLNGLSPGDYRVETTIRDILGKQSQTVVAPFKVEGP